MFQNSNPTGANLENLVLAKDRHFLRQLKQQIKRADADEADAAKVATLQQKYERIFAQSNAAVLARHACVPDIQLNEELPVSNESDALIKAIQENQVIIVAGETGSGKTTQLPKIAMLAGRGITGQIGHTQPRRLAARSVSERIAEELGEPLGKTVSYKVRFNESGSKASLVKLMTDGILLAELAHDRFLTKYDTLIIDEAHERSLNIDFILGYLKQLLPKRADLKVIITSATLDVKRFSEYFTFTRRGKTFAAPVFKVEGRSYPVDIIYKPILENAITGSDDDEFDDLEDDAPLAVVGAVEDCFALAQKQGHGSEADILIFASTEREIRDLAEELSKQSASKRWQAEVLMLFARQSLSDQQKIFHPNTRKAPRRIIISTNVAETAVTVPNIRFVIDIGFARISRYSYRSRVQRLPIEAISQAAANQRAGRCGRIAAGTCIRLYSEQDFLNRPEFTEPEIKRTNLASVMLQMANLRLGSVEGFDFIDPPDYRLVNDGRKLLSELGAFANTPKLVGKGKATGKRKQHAAYKLSKTGRQMAAMPIDPRLSRILIAGHEHDCLSEMLIIVSALSVQDPRERPADKTTQADQKHALFKQDDSDFLFYTALWQRLHDADNPLSGNARKRFAKNHFLSWLRLREWDKAYEQLSQLCQKLKLTLNKEPASYGAIHHALLSGLLSHVAQKGDWGRAYKGGHDAGKDERGQYLAAKNKKVRVFPASTLYKSETDWLVAFEVVETTQVYVRGCAKVDPEWVLKTAQSQASELLKHHYFEPHWSKKYGKVQAYRQTSLFGLILESQQLVDYEKVDIEAAHEIFLRDALTTGNVGISAPFLSHNLNKLAQVALMEDKLRRKDLLVDEEDIYQFYAGKIPDHIASRDAFEFWRKEVEKKDAHILFFSDDDILAGGSATLDNQDFPQTLKLGEMSLPLKYVFDPSRDDDGVTVRVPQAALPQLDAVALTWGIPGWRDELVVSLLKSLPKSWRKKIVPIPDTAKKLMDRLRADNDLGLLTQLTTQLTQLGVVGVQPDDFDLSKIPDFLRPRVQVIDERKKTLAASRDIFDLQARYAPQQSTQEAQKGLHTEFLEHFVFENSRHQAGVVLREYHALQPAEDGVSVNIATLTDITLARQIHFDGIVCLLKAATTDKHKQIKKMIDKPLQLAFSPLGDKAQLEGMLIHAAASKTVYDAVQGKFKNLPIDKASYDAMLAELTGSLLTKANATFAVIKDIYLVWQQIRHDMLMLNTDVFADNIADIEDQLDGLHLHDFISRYPFTVWQEYPRYLDALKARIDKLSNTFENDSEGVALLDVHMNRLADIKRSKTEQIADFADYKWLVEEYRISLFAQPMKTKQPVSEKRLEKLWDKLTRSKL